MLHVRNADKISFEIIMILIVLNLEKVLRKARTFVTVDDSGAFLWRDLLTQMIDKPFCTGALRRNASG